MIYAPKVTDRSPGEAMTPHLIGGEVRGNSGQVGMEGKTDAKPNQTNNLLIEALFNLQ